RRLERRGRFRFLDMLTVKEPAVHTVLNMVVEEAEKFKARRLVLDSYSALAQAFKDPMDARIVAHTLLGKLIRMMGCTTILIEEVPIGSSKIGFGVEEFVADGVLRLSLDELEGYRLRRLEILKLRGVRLKDPKLVYTLEGGFKAFPPFNPQPVDKPRRFQPLPDQPGKYSTGSKSLDEALGGGLPKSSVTLLETDEKTTIGTYRLILSVIRSNFSVQGRNVFMIPSSWIDVSMLQRGLVEHYGITEDEWTRTTRIVTAKGFKSLKSSPVAVFIKGVDWKEDLDQILAEYEKLSAKSDKPSLFIIGADTLAKLYGDKHCMEIIDLTVAEVKDADATIIIPIAPSVRHLTFKISPMAEIHLRLTMQYGCPMLYGVKPRTGLYAVESDASEGYPVPKLTPII
ncbi:MAG: ATPase domain-containing protein, partial [Candidatus Bathyarchaeia archaeon]